MIDVAVLEAGIPFEFSRSTEEHETHKTIAKIAAIDLMISGLLSGDPKL